MSTTQNWNRRGLAGPLCTIMIMAVMGLAALWLARPVSASDAQTAATVTSDARDELQQATEALRRVASVKTIPAAVADKALGVAVFGNLVKGAFIVGGTGGDGVFMRKTASGWGAPAFVNLAGASVGAQIGGSKTDAVFFFMDQASIDALAAASSSSAASITAVAGPASATAETLSTSTTNKVFVYSKQEGLFAGASAERDDDPVRQRGEQGRLRRGGVQSRDGQGRHAEGPRRPGAGAEGVGQAGRQQLKRFRLPQPAGRVSVP